MCVSKRSPLSSLWCTLVLRHRDCHMQVVRCEPKRGKNPGYTKSTTRIFRTHSDDPSALINFNGSLPASTIKESRSSCKKKFNTHLFSLFNLFCTKFHTDQTLQTSTSTSSFLPPLSHLLLFEEKSCNINNASLDPSLHSPHPLPALLQHFHP